MMNVTWFLEHDWNDPTYPALVRAAALKEWEEYK